MAFDYKKSLIKVQGGRTYLPVSARLVWFREDHADWGIVTEPLEINHEKQYAVFRATIFNAEGKIMAVGTKKEDVKGFGDYIEKSETGAVGRALAMCGYGTQFSPELDESGGGGRFADSPQPMGGNRYGGGGGGGNYGGGGGNRYGNNNNGGGGGNYSGPRNDAPRSEVPREESNSRFSAPPPITRDEPPARPAENQARPTPEVKRPAPPPPTPDEDDEFEAMVGGDALLASAEDDPFGNEDAAPRPTPAKPSADNAPASSGPPACISCGKALTKAQQELSIRNYGKALCPTCQKDSSRTKQPALA